jgi:hypothetical protein
MSLININNHNRIRAASSATQRRHYRSRRALPNIQVQWIYAVQNDQSLCRSWSSFLSISCTDIWLRRFPVDHFVHKSLDTYASIAVTGACESLNDFMIWSQRITITVSKCILRMWKIFQSHKLSSWLLLFTILLIERWSPWNWNTGCPT